MPELFDRIEFKEIRFADQRFQDAAIERAVDDLAGQLSRGRVSESPFVYVFAHNHIKTVIAYFAVWRAGLIVVPVDPVIRPLELGDWMLDSPPCATVRIDPRTPAFDLAAEVAFHEPQAIDLGDADLADVCMLAYTAAEDGHYKGVLLTRDNLLANAQAIIDCAGMTRDHVSAALAPFHHMYGLQTGMLAPIASGSSALVVDFRNLKLLETFVQEIERAGVTHLYSLPVVYLLMARMPGIKDRLRSVRAAVSGGYKLPATIFDSFLKKTGLEIQEGYGLTEAAPICAWHRPGDRIRIDSVGRAFSCSEICVMDDRDRPVPAGQTGEICVRGANVMKGYFRHKEATARALRGGWLHTGDLGRLDGDGYVYLTGLAKKMLNVMGKNVYPEEIERQMRRHGNVAEAEISGEELALGGHQVHARIRLAEGSPEARSAFESWCNENLSRYKLPKSYSYD